MDDAAARASLLMSRFADRTAVTADHAGPRHLWTDAFAVMSFRGLARSTGDDSFDLLAAELVVKVHATLGRYRTDDTRTGWLAGLTGEEAGSRPTAGGLRIGNRLPERAADEPFDPVREWDRDGQCFHCLMKWTLALDRMADHARDASLHRCARELAVVARRGFVRGGVDRRHLSWKMSTDLSRPLVDAMCPHDAVDGYIACLELDEAARELGSPATPSLVAAREDYASMIVLDELPTADPLGIGELLLDAWRLAQVDTRSPLLARLLHGARIGLVALAPRFSQMEATRRIPLEELGLASGLAAAGALAAVHPGLEPAAADELLALNAALPLQREIVAFWLDDEVQRGARWLARRDLHDVMLATCLCPQGLLGQDGRGTPRARCVAAEGRTSRAARGADRHVRCTSPFGQRRHDVRPEYPYSRPRRRRSDGREP